jgi:hypothetical protein
MSILRGPALQNETIQGQKNGCGGKHNVKVPATEARPPTPREPKARGAAKIARKAIVLLKRRPPACCCCNNMKSLADCVQRAAPDCGAYELTTM